MNARFKQWISLMMFKFFSNSSPLYMNDVFKPADKHNAT